MACQIAGLINNEAPCEEGFNGVQGLVGALHLLTHSCQRPSSEPLLQTCVLMTDKSGTRNTPQYPQKSMIHALLTRQLDEHKENEMTARMREKRKKEADKSPKVI